MSIGKKGREELKSLLGGGGIALCLKGGMFFRKSDGCSKTQPPGKGQHARKISIWPWTS